MNKTILYFASFMACLCALGANVYTNSFVKDGVTYVQRGGLTVKDYVVTNVVGGIGGGNVESVNGQTGVVVIGEVNSATNWINKPSWIEDNWATLANEANYSTEAGHVPWEGIEGKPDWIGDTKPTYTAADVGALPVNNTNGELNFGILYGDGITLGGANYNDTYPGRVHLEAGSGSYIGGGLDIQGRLSIKDSDFTFGPGELLVNGTNVMDAIAAAGKVKSVNGMEGEVVLTASELGAATHEDVTAAIREQSLGGIWDAELQVWWTPRMRNGSLTYEATTNVNLNAEN